MKQLQESEKTDLFVDPFEIFIGFSYQFIHRS